MEFKHQKDLGPDAIQKWCEELDRKPKRELTPEEGKTLFMCMINEPHYRTDKNFESLLGKWNGVAILHDRIKENHTYTIENAVLLFLGSVIDRPGIAVQYANFMQYKCWQYHIKHVDMKSFTRRILPQDFSPKMPYMKCGTNKSISVKKKEDFSTCWIMLISCSQSEK